MQLCLLGRRSLGSSAGRSLVVGGGRRALFVSQAFREQAPSPAASSAANGPPSAKPPPSAAAAAAAASPSASSSGPSSTPPTAAPPVSGSLSRRRPVRALPDVFRLTTEDEPRAAPKADRPQVASTADRAIASKQQQHQHQPSSKRSSQQAAPSSFSSSSSSSFRSKQPAGPSSAPAARQQKTAGGGAAPPAGFRSSTHRASPAWSSAQASSSSSAGGERRASVRPEVSLGSTATGSSFVTPIYATLDHPAKRPPPPPKEKLGPTAKKKVAKRAKLAANSPPYVRPTPPPPLPGERERPPGRSIMIRGFGPDVSEHRLKTFVELNFGRVYYISIPPPKQWKGVHHGYVTFEKPSACEKALEQGTAMLDGAEVTIRPSGEPEAYRKALKQVMEDVQAELKAPGPDSSPVSSFVTPSGLKYDISPSAEPSEHASPAAPSPRAQQSGSTPSSSVSSSRSPAPVAQPQPSRAPHFLRLGAPAERLQQFRPAAFPPATSVLTDESFRHAIAVFQPLYAGGRWSEKTFLEDGVERTYLVREIPRDEFVEGIFEREHFERLGDWSPTVMGTLFPRWASAIQDLHNHHAEIRSNREVIRIRIISHKTFYPATPLGSLPDPLRPPVPPQGLTTRDLHLAASLENLVRHIKEMLGQEATGL